MQIEQRQVVNRRQLGNRLQHLAFFGGVGARGWVMKMQEMLGLQDIGGNGWLG
jgi:hypothetical protein